MLNIATILRMVHSVAQYTASPRRLLLSKRHFVSQYAHKSNFIDIQKITALSSPYFHETQTWKH
jgi:hypothetical protein